MGTNKMNENSMHIVNCQKKKSDISISGKHINVKFNIAI